MRFITLVGATFLGGFLVGHGFGAVLDLLPLFAMITLLYAGIGVYETLHERTAVAAPIRRIGPTSRHLTIHRRAA